jgi:hypothetical protein
MEILAVWKVSWQVVPPTVKGKEERNRIVRRKQ